MSGNGDKSKAGKTQLICPRMSGQLVMTESQPGGVLTPGKPILTPSVVVCVEERCRLWHNPNRCCSEVQQAEATLQVALSVMEIKNALEPLRLLTGSLRRLCDKINDVILFLETKKRG